MQKKKKIARKIAEYFTFISHFVNCRILILEQNLIITKTRLVSAILNFQKMQVLNIIFTNQDVWIKTNTLLKSHYEYVYLKI